MNIAFATGCASVVLYFSTVTLVALAIKRRSAIHRTAMLMVASLALCLHSVNVYFALFADNAVRLDLFNIATLFGWVLAMIATSSVLRRPVETLAAFSYGISALALLLSLLFTTPHTPNTTLSVGVYAHILLSIVAYCVIAMAMVQATILAVQDRQLKRKHTHDMIHLLPPLQTMESLLFEWLALGMALLTAAMAVGFVYVGDFWAQHLIHKTVLSIAAWGVFFILLTGRYFLGWRGSVAIRWTLAGFVMLMLAYFGSKLVLEVLLQRG